MLETRESSHSPCTSDSWTTEDSSHRSSDSGRCSNSSDGESYRCVATLSGHSGPIASLAVVGNVIYSGDSDKSDIRVWSQPEMTEVCRFGAGDGSVKALVALGDHIFSAHQDMKIRVWKPFLGGEKGPKLVATMPTFKDYLLRTFVPSRKYVQVRRHRKSLWIQHNDAISVVARGAGNVVYSGSWDKSIKMWRMSDFKCLESITGHHDAVSSLVADQRGFLYSSSADSTVKVWSKIGKKHSLVTTLKEHKSSVNALALSPDESLLYAASSDKTISVWERTEAGNEAHMKLIGSLTGHRKAVLCMASAGDIMCTGSADKTVRVWRRSGNSHSLVTVLEGHRGPVRSVCAITEVVETGVMIYSGSADKSVKVWWIAPPNKQLSPDDLSSSDTDRSGSGSGSLLKWRY